MKALKLILRVGRVILTIAGALFVVLWVVAWIGSLGAATPEQSFDIAKLERGSLKITVSSTGNMAALGTVEVGTQVSGTIQEISADYNDQVKKGQILVVLDQSLYKAELQKSEAALASARAQLEQARADYQRNVGLHEKDFISNEEFQGYQTALNQAQAEVSSAQAAVSSARTNLGNTVIRSPIDGTVIQRSIDAGQTVAASLSAPTLFVIAEDLSRMQIEADVDETDIGRIKVGQPVSFEVSAYAGRRFEGAVSQIRLQPEEVSNVVTYTVIVDAANPEGLLLPGMTATLEFLVLQQDDVLLAPNAALRVSLGPAGESKTEASGQQGRIYLIDGQTGRPRPVQVSVGESDGTVSVVSGADLQEGAQVITGVLESADGSKGGLFSMIMPRPRGKSGGGPPPM